MVNYDWDDDVMTAKEAAKYLKIALPTLYRYMQRERIPCFKLGNQWRFKRSSLDKWIEEKSKNFEEL